MSLDAEKLSEEIKAAINSVTTNVVTSQTLDSAGKATDVLTGGKVDWGIDNIINAIASAVVAHIAAHLTIDLSKTAITLTLPIASINVTGGAGPSTNAVAISLPCNSITPATDLIPTLTGTISSGIS